MVVLEEGMVPLNLFDRCCAAKPCKMTSAGGTVMNRLPDSRPPVLTILSLLDGSWCCGGGSILWPCGLQGFLWGIDLPCALTCGWFHRDGYPHMGGLSRKMHFQQMI